MIKKYLAISIGPVVNTIIQARKTRELWAASYIFSNLMRRLLEEVEQLEGVSVLSPQVAKAENSLFGVGIYPDKLLARVAANCTDAQLATLIEKAKIKAAQDMLPKNSKEAEVIAFWSDYFRVNWVLKDIEKSDEKVIDKVLNPYLMTQELVPSYFTEQKTDALLSLLNAPYNTPMSDAALNDASKGSFKGLMRGKFPSTADLGTIELYQRGGHVTYKALQEAAKKEAKEQDDESDKKALESFYKRLETHDEFKKIAMPRHKYYCIVHADGDNFGKINEALKGEDALVDFSKELANYSATAASIINEYGGKPVFIGGDDLLFFAPVVSEKGSIFELIKALDKHFDGSLKRYVTEQLKIEQRPSLSYGITISYYKYPLLEAYSSSRSQLEDRAKKTVQENGSSKNAIAFRLVKHSGAYYEAILTKELLAELIKIQKNTTSKQEDLISSIRFKMKTLEVLLKALKDRDELDLKRVEYLFENFFDEPIHEVRATDMSSIQSLVLQVYQTALSIKKGTEKEAIKAIDNLVAILQIIKFITDKPKTA